MGRLASAPRRNGPGPIGKKSKASAAGPMGNRFFHPQANTRCDCFLCPVPRFRTLDAAYLVDPLGGQRLLLEDGAISIHQGTGDDIFAQRA
jgi:hypothetical protein